MKIHAFAISCMVAFSNYAIGQTSQQKDSNKISVREYWYNEYIKDINAEMSKFYNAYPPSKKDSIAYMVAVDAYDKTSRRQNRAEYVRNYIDRIAHDKQVQKDENERKKRLINSYGKKVAEKLLKQEVWIGMTDKMVKDEFGWAEVKRTVTGSDIYETWFYLGPNQHCIGDCPYLDYSMTFKNHVLIAISDL